jgi:hypothetical protein
MTNLNGWPDPARPGVPMNPEDDIFHWLQHEDAEDPCALQWWSGDDVWFLPRLGSKPRCVAPETMAAEGWRYLGPCATPAEIEALKAERNEAVATLESYRMENGCTRGQRTTQWCGAAVSMQDERDAALARAERAEAVLRRWQHYGCPDCGGDCGSANPPVLCCIMQETHAALTPATRGEGG